VTADTDRKASDGEEMIIIKRVIGLPGERVRIENGHVYINDRQLEEPYLPESVRTYPHNPDYANVLLGEDEYYLLGDNRENSQDSRDIGAVSRGDIEGKLLIRFYPFSRFGVPD
jgi:signal peptidase I